MTSPRRPCTRIGVGWVERSETHRCSRQIRRALVAKMTDDASAFALRATADRSLIRPMSWLSTIGLSPFQPFVARMSGAICGMA